MQAAIAQALASGSPTVPAALVADLGLALHAVTCTASTGAGPVEARSIAEERQLLLPAPPPPSPPSGSQADAPHKLPPAGDGPFQDYLRRKLALPALRLDRVEQLSGGFSRVTIALHCTEGDQPKDIILRKEVPGGLLDGVGASVCEEYPLLLLASQGGVPTPPLLWLEPDPAVIGSAFIAMERVSGRSAGTPLGTRSPLTAQDLHQLGVMLARLHAIDWRGAQSSLSPRLGFSAENDHPKAAAQAMLQRWERYWKSVPLPHSPLLSTAMAWMRANLPAQGLPPCITHGDVGFHNIMRDASGYTALLDWEAACLASPVKDISNIRISIPAAADWDVFLQAYRDAGGAKMSSDEIKWFEVFRAFAMTLVCKVALAKMAEPAAARLDYLQLGLLAQPVFFDQLAALLPAMPTAA